MSRRPPGRAGQGRGSRARRRRGPGRDRRRPRRRGPRRSPRGARRRGPRRRRDRRRGDDAAVPHRRRVMVVRDVGRWSTEAVDAARSPTSMIRSTPPRSCSSPAGAQTSAAARQRGQEGRATSSTPPRRVPGRPARPGSPIGSRPRRCASTPPPAPASSTISARISAGSRRSSTPWSAPTGRARDRPGRARAVARRRGWCRPVGPHRRHRPGRHRRPPSAPSPACSGAADRHPLGRAGHAAPPLRGHAAPRRVGHHHRGGGRGRARDGPVPGPQGDDPGRPTRVAPTSPVPSSCSPTPTSTCAA